MLTVVLSFLKNDLAQFGHFQFPHGYPIPK